MLFRCHSSCLPINHFQFDSATVLVITPDNSAAFSDKANEVFRIPECSSTLARLLTVIPAQLFAYYCAIQRGFDPDKPRNPAKSVTVE
jgi:glucosamine--fructose-6-phosphate aminotransferase (isomerizing)